MAFTVVKNLTDISNCESTTSWSGAPALSTALVREGTNALSAQVSNTTANFVYTGAPLTTPVNMTNQRIYIWVAAGGALDTLANGGLGIIIGDGTNQRAYYVGGSDRLPFQVGPFSCLCLDCSNLPANFAQITGAGAPNITAINAVGLRVKTIAKATGSSPNTYWDMVRYGTGLTVYGGSSGSPETFAQIAADDASLAAGKAYGIVRKIGTGIYEIQGDLTFGDSAGVNTSYFKDSDCVVGIADNVLGASTNTEIKLTVTGNATGTDRHFELGLAVGSGDTQRGRQGVVVRNENISGQPVTFTASNANVKEVLLYGCNFVGLKKTTTAVDVAFSSDATNGPNHKLSGTTFDRCGEIDFGRTVVRNCVVSGYTGTKGALQWNSNINIKSTQFIANTNASNAAGIEHPNTTGNPFTYDGLTFSGNDFDINNTSGSGITINPTNGANPTTSEGSSVTINASPVTVTATITDTAGAAIENARVFVKAIAGGPFPADATVTIVNSGTTATVTHTSHGMATNDYVVISGASLDVNNGVFQITVTGVNTYTYTLASAPGSNPTGTIKSSFVLINGTSAVGTGQISMSRVFPSNQPVTGWSRKSTSAPYYKQGTISGTVSSSTGATLSAVLTSDD